jgi:hypothetical protein
MRCVVLVAAALLAACGPSNSGVAAKPAEVAQAKAALARLKADGGQVMGLARPANMPSFAVLPPDGFVTAADEADQGPRTGWVEFSTVLTPGAVAAFYREVLTGAGLKDIRRDAEGLTATGAGRNVKLTIRALDGVGSEVRLSYS